MSARLENGKNGVSYSEEVGASTNSKLISSTVVADEALHKLEQGCPFLGTVDDPDTRYLFATPIGSCYRAKPAEPISIEHQQAYCLNAQHANCPVFKRATAGPLPADLRLAPLAQQGGTWQSWIGWAALAVLLLTIAAFLIAWRSNQTDEGDPLPLLAALETETPTPMPTETPSPTAVPFIAPVETATALPPATPTAAPTETPTAVVSPTLPPTFTPAPSATPSPTPTPASFAIINVRLLNVRQGPGIEYPIVGEAALGSRFTITGQSANQSWWQICCIADEPGWVFGESVLIEGDTSSLPIVITNNN